MNDCNCSGGGLKDFSPQDFKQPVKDNPLFTTTMVAVIGGVGIAIGMLLKKGKK